MMKLTVILMDGKPHRKVKANFSRADRGGKYIHVIGEWSYMSLFVQNPEFI